MDCSLSIEQVVVWSLDVVLGSLDLEGLEFGFGSPESGFRSLESGFSGPESGFRSPESECSSPEPGCSSPESRFWSQKHDFDGRLKIGHLHRVKQRKTLLLEPRHTRGREGTPGGAAREGSMLTGSETYPPASVGWV